MVKKRILVTGGAGYVGTALLSKLLEAGHEVTVFDNLMQGGNQLLSFFLSLVRIYPCQQTL